MLQRRSDAASYDVIVVGARCAGSPLATMLARRGMRVCLVDRADFPSDTPSTHGILSPGVKVLERLGLRERIEEVAPPVDAAYLGFGERTIEFDSATRVAGAPTFNVRRITLDAILLEAARAAGAEARLKTPVTGLLRSGGRVVGVETPAGELRAPLVVGADGARSTVARLVGAVEYHRTAPERVFLWSYFEGVEEEVPRIWLGNIAGNSYLASASDNGLFLAALVAPIRRRDELRADRAAGCEAGLRLWPELARKLAGGRRVGPVRMMSRWHGFFRQSAGPGWALLGDAGHFKDPTPGQGISDALRQAEAMAPAIARALADGADPEAPLREWWKWRDRDCWEMYWFAREMGESDRRPLLSAAFQARFAEDPELVDDFFRVVGHQASPAKVFGPAFGFPLLGRALRNSPGQRLALLKEARGILAEQGRRQLLGATSYRRPY